MAPARETSIVSFVDNGAAAAGAIAALLPTVGTTCSHGVLEEAASAWGDDAETGSRRHGEVGGRPQAGLATGFEAAAGLAAADLRAASGPLLLVTVADRAAAVGAVEDLGTLPSPPAMEAPSPLTPTTAGDAPSATRTLFGGGGAGVTEAALSTTPALPFDGRLDDDAATAWEAGSLLANLLPPPADVLAEGAG